MEDYNFTKENIERLKNIYTPGTYIMCDFMYSEHPIEAGRVGIVQHVRDDGVIMVDWGDELIGLIKGVDEFHIPRWNKRKRG